MSNNHVKPEEIEYLSLEGGGGKGFAYLGAIDALNSIKGWDWNRIKGFSGSSAGAITAMLLSIGFTTKEQISTFMEEKIKKETFFEPANPRYIPYPGDYIKAPSLPTTLDFAKAMEKLAFIFFLHELINTRNLYTKVKEKTINNINKLIRDINNSLNRTKRKMIDLVIELIKWGIKNPHRFVVPPLPVWESVDSMRQNKPFFSEIANENDIFTKTVDAALQQLVKAISELEKEPDSSLPLILYYLPRAFNYLAFDMGLFHGKKAREVFDEVIASAMRQSKRNITFEEHFNFFKKKLVVTGTNLTTGRTILFSVDETRKFPVADAVRISMSLPFIFKPYVIQESGEGYPPCGVYVDGGLFNNSPLHVFDDEIWDKQEEAKKNSFSVPLSKALGLRLEFEKPFRLPVMHSPLNFYYPFLSMIMFYGIFGTGESQVLQRESNRYIVLDSEPLSTLGFDPPKDDIVFKRSRRTVYRYFGLQIEPNDRDDQDDQESDERKKRANNPCGT